MFSGHNELTQSGAVVYKFGVLALCTGLLTALATVGPADARGNVKHGKALAPVAKATAKSKAPASEAFRFLPPQEPFPESTVAKTDLAVGDLHATVTASDAGGVLPVGSSASVTITIKAAGGNRTAAVLVEAEGGEVLALSGGGAKASAVRAGLVADVALPASGSMTLNAEMGLKSGAKGADGKPRNRLRVTVLPQLGGRDETVFSWGLADCAGDYYAELQKILRSRREHMVPMLEAAFATDPELPGKWMFPTQITSPLRICKGAKGKKLATCTGATSAKSADKQAGKPEMDEPRVLQLANQILAMKGALPGFQKRAQPLRQVSNTLLNGLRVYMEQDAHPALCSGVDSMVGYYNDHTPLLRNTIAEGRNALPAAQKLAIAKVADLAKTPAASNSSSGSGVISAAVASEPAQAGYVATDLVDRIGKAILSAPDASETVSIQALPAKLEHMRALLDGAATVDLAPDKRTAALSALRLIEANLYLATAAKKYAGLDDAIYGTMSAITDAHKAKCVCQ